MESIIEVVFSSLEVILMTILEVAFEERQRKRRPQAIEKYVAR